MDNFFTRHIKRETAAAAPAACSQEEQPKGGSYGNNAVLVNSDTAALSVAAFNRAIVLRANTMSQLKVQLQVLDKNGGNFVEAKRMPLKHINYLLQVRPNPTMSASVMFRQAMINVDLKGNAIIYIERNMQGDIVHFWLCKNAILNPDYTYDIIYTDVVGDVRKTVNSSSVAHFRGPLTKGNGIWGLSLLDHGRKALTLAATNDKLVTDNAAKGGKMKLLVQEEKQGSFGMGRANKKELEKVTRQLQNDIYEQDVVLLNNIANVTPISQSMQQQEIQMARQFSVREISRLTGVPPVLLMDDSNSSYKSPEAATQDFLLRTISPIIREWEDELNDKIIGEEGYGIMRIHLCEKPLLRLDPIATANVGKTQLETGIMTVNELRKEHDQPTVKDGDIVYISTNLAQIGSEKLSGAAQEPEEGEKGGEV